MPIEITEVEWRYYVLTALRELEQESPEEDGFPLAEIYDRVEEKIEADFRLANNNRRAKIRQTLGEGRPDGRTNPKQYPLVFRNVEKGVWRTSREGEG